MKLPRLLRSPPATTSARPIVWLHIGHGKTGTTALQNYFRQRHAHDPNFCYPDSGQMPSGAHHLLFPLGQNGEHASEAMALLRRVRKNMTYGDDRFIVMSSEHLCYFRVKQVERLARVFEGCDLRVLYFARRQDDLIESTFKWMQIARPGQVPDLAGFIERSVPSFDFLARLAPWRNVLGDAAIYARLYHRETCGPNIAGAAEAVMELAPYEKGETAKRYRGSLGATLTRALMAYNALHDDPEKRQGFLQELLRIETDHGPIGGAPLLSSGTRHHIMKRYAASNAEFSATFLSPEEGAILMRNA